MSTTIQAVFESGVLRPLAPLNLPEGQRVQVIIASDETSKTEMLSVGMQAVIHSTKAAEDHSEDDFWAANARPEGAAVRPAKGTALA